MAGTIREDKRSRLGYGSSYRKGEIKEHADKKEIETVLGGQVWMVKPDKQAKASRAKCRTVASPLVP